MSPAQLKMRQSLLALYCQVPESVAKDMTVNVMEAVDELHRTIKELEDALKSQRHADGCFCEASFSMPDGSHPSHTKECMDSQLALDKANLL